jgi:hypothetical protein
MNQTLIKKLFIISIFFNSITPSSNKQNSKLQKRPPHSNTKNMPIIQQMIQQGVSSLPQQQMMTQQQMQQPMPAINNQTAPQPNTPNNLINMAQNLYSNQAPTNITSNQIAANGMSMTIVQQLDPIKAAQLVADIYTLQQNYFILSEIIETTISKNFNPKINSQQRQSQYTYRLNDPAFDPTKKIINAAGGYTDAPMPKSTAINPFTGTPITLFDLATLKQIRKLLLNNIQLMLFALGDMDACAWNVQQMISNMPVTKQWLSANANQPNAYSLNALRPLWKQSTDYIGQGKLRKGIIKTS